MSNQLFIDDFIVSTYAHKLSGSNSWYLSGGISKGLGHSRMVIGCDVSASANLASSMRDDIVQDFCQRTLSVKPYFKGSLCKWLSMNYDASHCVSQLTIGDIDNTSQSLNQEILASVIPQDRLQFSIGAEHYLTRFPEGDITNLLLLDASAVWHASNRVRLSLTANNLLNKRHYEYVTYGTLSRTEHSFSIRSRMILATIQYRF